MKLLRLDLKRDEGRAEDLEQAGVAEIVVPVRVLEAPIESGVPAWVDAYLLDDEGDSFPVGPGRFEPVAATEVFRPRCGTAFGDELTVPVGAVDAGGVQGHNGDRGGRASGS